MSLGIFQSNICADATAVLLPHGETRQQGLKMVLTLLAEAIAIHVQFPIIEVEKPSFERLFARTKPVILF